MPFGITDILACFKPELWKWIGKKMKPGKCIYVDSFLSLVSTWNIAAMIIMVSVNLCNAYFGSSEFSCTGNDMPGIKYNPGEHDSYCWHQGTYLVSQCFDPKYKDTSMYPGICRYGGTPEIIKIPYNMSSYVPFAFSFGLSVLLNIAMRVSGFAFI